MAIVVDADPRLELGARQAETESAEHRKQDIAGLELERGNREDKYLQTNEYCKYANTV